MDIYAKQFGKMKPTTKSEWFVLDRPFAEPNEKFYEKGNYHIERTVDEKGCICWYGCAKNWKKESNGKWTELATNYDAKPLEKYLPDIIYGEDRTYWKECDIPIYEILYLQLKNNID